MAVTTLNDITIICLPLPVGKTLHICSRVTPTHLSISRHPHWTILTDEHDQWPEHFEQKLQLTMPGG